MPRSVTSVFSEPEDFQTALREDGMLGMLIIGRGRFQARLTQIMLHGLRLSAAEEHLSRIAFVTVPADAVLVALPIGGGPSPIWGGIAMQVHEIITLGPGSACACTNRWALPLGHHPIAGPGPGRIWPGAERSRVRRSSLRRAMATSACGS